MNPPDSLSGRLDHPVPVTRPVRVLTLAGLLSLLVICPLTSPPSLTPGVLTPPSAPAAPSLDTPTPPDALLLAPCYAISLTMDIARSQVIGEQQVRYTNTEAVPLPDLYFRLFPNTPGYGGEMRVTSIHLNGNPARPEARLNGSALRLPLHPPLDPMETVTLTLAFTATVPLTDEIDYAQFSYVRGVMALPGVYPIIPVYDDEGWNVEIAPEYGDAVHSDIAFYQVDVTAPPTMTLVASGTCAVLEAGRWSCQAGPVRDFVLILGERYQIAHQVAEGVLVHSYFYPDHRESGEQVLRMAVDALTLYSRLFGPYPYEELDVVETPTRAGGIEYPTLVVISEHLYTGHPRLEWVVAHEVAHQWWYGVVGSDPVDEPWLDEALTQYTTLLYHEFLHGPETAADILKNDFQATYDRLVKEGKDRPVGLPVAAYPRDLYSPVVYRKGPLYFHALRERVGDETFFAILQAYYRRHRYGIATPDSFLATVREIAGNEHRDLYERWILGVSR
ncbi:MAG: M1 family metallopeptidase [Anaerolineae bacterium]|nr:M1 family metallopeptidase [Anaerolineae bacterium]MDW8068010.1 M1 family metallopeptidase [Anaerolineae bacterium]